MKLGKALANLPPCLWLLVALGTWPTWRTYGVDSFSPGCAATPSPAISPEQRQGSSCAAPVAQSSASSTSHDGGFGGVWELQEHTIVKMLLPQH